MKHKAYLGFFCTACLCLLFLGCRDKTSDSSVISVELQRQDGESASVGNGFSFDDDQNRDAVKKYHPKLPENLPPEAKLGYCPSGPVFGVLYKEAASGAARFLLDSNLNHDLTDDDILKLPTSEKWDEGLVVRFPRTYDQPEAHTILLPYKIGHQVYEDRNGEQNDSVFLCTDYAYHGSFSIGERTFGLKLIDGDGRGRFIKDKVVNVFIQIGPLEDMDTPGKTKMHRPFELAQIGDSLYEFDDMAEDGSRIVMTKSDLTTILLGETVPEFTMTDRDGITFSLNEYSGKMLLLDFWPVWCKPCVAKFPDIKRMINKYADKPFAVIGINIDEKRRVEAANKVIEEHDLNWRQVVEGRGEFIPVYQVLGRLPETEMSFPVYIAIDEEGVARYATNDYLKMERFLDFHFSNTEEDNSVLFIPLKRQYHQTNRLDIPVDFTSDEVRSLLESDRLVLPFGAETGTHLGLLPNGTALLVWPNTEEQGWTAVLDSNRDFDLTNDKRNVIPVVTGPVTDDEQTAKMDYIISFENGGKTFASANLFIPAGGSSDADGPPAVVFRGKSYAQEGRFVINGREYRITIWDPTGDFLFTKNDEADPSILQLERKKGEDWRIVHQGITHIPIGRDRYRIRSISPDGRLIELEREKESLLSLHKEAFPPDPDYPTSGDGRFCQTNEKTKKKREVQRG